MSLKTARTLTGAYFALMLFFVTWPGFVPFAGAEPFIFGLPFSLAWVAGWIAGSVVVLTLLDRVEGRHRAAAANESERGRGTDARAFDSASRGGH